MPENAGVIELGAGLLPPSVLRSLLKQAPWSRSQESYYAWFTEDLTYPSLLKKEILGAHPALQELQAKHLFKRLSRHPDTPSIVTFDEWTENSDRNPGNLVEIKGGKLALIDHGRLFRYPTWSPSTLASGGGLPYTNRLSDYVDSVDRQWSGKTRTRSARLLTYNNLAALWRDGGQAAASELLDIFLDQEQRDTVISFLSAALEPAQYSAKVGLLA